MASDASVIIARIEDYIVKVTAIAHGTHWLGCATVWSSSDWINKAPTKRCVIRYGLAPNQEEAQLAVLDETRRQLNWKQSRI